MKQRVKIFGLDYRHLLCIFITLGFLAFGFLFPNALPRIAEAFRDLGTSCAYYFFGIIDNSENPINATVTQMPSWQFAESPWKSFDLFPRTWEEFKVLFGDFLNLLFTKENFRAYWSSFGNVLYYFSKFLLIFLPLVLAIIMKLRSYTEKRTNKRNVKSKHLIRYEKFKFKVVYPVISWFKDFVFFLRENSRYYKLWLFIWLVHFNTVAIIVEFIAFCNIITK